MMRINITLPESLLSKLDEHCAQKGFERSEFIRHLIRTKLDEDVDKGHTNVDDISKDIHLEESPAPLMQKPEDISYCQVKNFTPFDYCKAEAVSFFQTPKYFKGNEEISHSGWLCDNHYNQCKETSWGEY